MTENTTTEDYVYKYKNNNEQSLDEINNSTVLLNQYQSFVLNEYSFIIGTTDNGYIYIECKNNDKYYKKLISKKNICIINDKFQSCKDINEIYKLIILSINNNELKINSIKNNKIKFTLFITPKDSPTSSFEIILKEEKNKSDLILNQSNAKNDIESNSEIQKENSSILMDEELQYIKNEILANHNNKNKDSIKLNLPNEEKNKEKKENNNKILNEVEDEEEEDDDDIDSHENEINKINTVIIKLKKEILYIKNKIDKKEENKNEIRIKDLEIKNEKLLEEITKIKNDLQKISEENKRNIEEINNLKISLNNKRSSTKNIEYYSEDNNTIKEIVGLTTGNNALFKTPINDELKNYKSSSRKKIKKKKKSKSQRKSVVFNNRTNDDAGGINLFIFKQKYNIKESESELDLTNKKIGDRGLDLLTQMDFQHLKSLSLDNNGLFVINSLVKFSLNNLEVLNLDNNIITDINILEKVKFPSLQILWLNNNNISDISVFERVKFKQLQHLWLNNNNISDISVFKKAYLNKLERLYLKNNKIEDISCLEEIELNKLQLIYLNQNRIDFNLDKNKNTINNLKKKIRYLSY